ncbi:MAG: 50S ribosomal protein L21 [Candidatus Firestonebacteria bacterium]
MYAVIETGGKQYKVAVGDKIDVEKLDAKPGEMVELDKVLMVADDGKVNIGTPVVEGAKVIGELILQDRAKKIRISKYKKRKNSKRVQGHRQYFTRLLIKEIKS